MQLFGINCLHRGASALQTRTGLPKWDNCITNLGITRWDNHYYKVGQLHTITKWNESYYKVKQVIYYKVGQPLLQSGATLLKSRAVITKHIDQRYISKLVTKIYCPPPFLSFSYLVQRHMFTNRVNAV